MTNGRPGKNNVKKRRLNNSTRERILSSILDRSLPLVILKALFIHLVSVQDFPEHRNLHLRTDHGASTIVVWCYYVLGLSVNVRVSGVDVNFGDDPQIFVEYCGPLQVFASVLDATGENEACFKLSQVEEDPPIQCENRTTARGFARKVMTLSGFSQATIDTQARQIAVDCIHLLPLTSQRSNVRSLKLVSMSSQIREHICKSTALLFDIPLLETTLTADLSNEKEQRRTMTRPGSNVQWAQLLLVIISFARVHDLSKCENLPLSLDAFWELSNEEFAVSVKGNQFSGTAPDTFVSFNIISRLLLGHQYSKEDVESSALVSSWGWSIFLDAFGALDPAHVRPGVIHIQLGVPSRNGERKTRVVDGPADIPIEYGTSLDHDGIPITFWPGVSDSQLSATLIGYSGRDAFSVVQVYEWNMNGQKLKKWRLGFRGKQEMCLKFTVIDQCPCATSLRDEESENWIDKFIAGDGAWGRATLGTATRGAINGMIRKYPSDSGDLSLSRERVFCCPLGKHHPTHGSSMAWFFFVTRNPASRWLAIDGLDQLKGEDGGFQHILRGNNCCVRCACEVITTKSLVLL